MCFFNYCRYADAPHGEHFSGHSDWISEHSRGDEPAQFQAADEHLFWPAAHCQHLRGLWKVQSGGTGFKLILAFPHQHILSDPLSESITKERAEVILQGTLSQDPKDPEAVWEEYQFRCKPGDIYRRPCLISPYHYRLDWLMWFAAFQVSFKSKTGNNHLHFHLGLVCAWAAGNESIDWLFHSNLSNCWQCKCRQMCIVPNRTSLYHSEELNTTILGKLSSSATWYYVVFITIYLVQYFHVYTQTYEQSEWVIHIAGRLLSNDSTVLSLLDHNPFQDRAAPR